MQQLGQLEEEATGQPAYFATTCWTTVAAAQQGAGGDRGKALQELCQIYWRPVFVYLRRRGCSPQDAQDATQDFFLDLLSGDLLDRVDRARGRFRAFLLTALNNFTADSHARRQALKRGGQYQFLSWEKLRATDTIAWTEPANQEGSPEIAFDRHWAQVLVTHTLAQLRQAMTKRGKEAVFVALHPFLTGPGEPGAQERAASQLGMSPANFRVTLHRLREQYRSCLRDEVARTVAVPGEISDELRHLAAVLLRRDD